VARNDNEYLLSQKERNMNEPKLHIAIILGTTRVGRRSENAARLVEKVGQQYKEIETRFVDPRDFEFPGDGNNPADRNKEYADITAWADGFFIITPEYNHGYPSSLKRMLDSEYGNYFYKPVALAGVSIGLFGGARCIEALLHTLRELHLIIMPQDVNFSKVQNVFDENGKLLDESYLPRIEVAWKELIWYTSVMKYGRDNVKR
jgi:NAD(P)H-dependent FMN reductase